MRRAVVCSLIVASAAAGGGVVFSRGGDAGRGSPPRAPAARDTAATPRRPGAVTDPAVTATAGRSPAHAKARSPSMPREYDVLLRRSIFGQGKARAAAGRAEGPAPETRWALRGVLLQEGRFTAFLEDVPARTLRRLRAGDPVARGRLESVSFDGLAYEADGVSTRVHIGQDLQGNAAPPPTTSPAAPAGGERGDKGERSEKGDRGDKGDKAEKAEKAARKDRQDDGENAGKRRREQ